MLEGAYRAEEAYNKGQYRALEGIPVAVKDNIDVHEEGGTGPFTTAGTSALLGHLPAYEGSLYHSTFRTYGALFSGKTTMSELCLGTASRNSLHGTPLNP